MQPSALTILILASLLYAGIALFGLLRQKEINPAQRFLSYYSLAAMAWSLLQIGLLLGWFWFLQKGFADRLPGYGMFFLSLLYFQTNLAFLGNRLLHPAGWVTLAAFGLGVMLADGIGYSQPALDWLTDVSQGALILAWMGIMLTAITYTAGAFRRRHQPLHRNRLLHWTPSLILVLLSDLLTLTIDGLSADLTRLVACLAMVYVVRTYQLPDIRGINRRLVRYLIYVLSSASLIVLSIFMFQTVARWYPADQILLLNTILILLIALLAKPLLDLVQRLAVMVTADRALDSARALRQYSLSISNTLDLEALAQVIADLVNQIFEAVSCQVILVEAQKEEGSTLKYGYKLQQAPHKGADSREPLELPVYNPLAGSFETGRRAISQYEIDLTPRFKALAPDLRRWLAALQADIFVPIYTKDEWVGLLAVGPKASGAPYQKDELDLLATLADQTSVALANARLVEGLNRLNNEFRRAYSALERSNIQLEKANQQLTLLDRTKTDFISITSHELRTPLTLISGYIQLLMDEPSLATHSSVEQLLQGISDGANRMHDVVSTMLDMASIDSKAMSRSSASVSLPDLIRVVGKSFQNAMAERSLRLEFDRIDELPTIQTDPEALQKVIYHLVINAIKYTPDGGKITIRGELLAAEESPLGEPSARITIQDTGIGIQADHLELIFAKFYQTGKIDLHSSGKTKFKGGGPGLGLSIARGIVEAMGGRVWAESPGYDEVKCPGSQFHVLLPVTEVPQVQEPTTQPLTINL
jgi:signal transduction histidine kinase